MLQRVTDGYRSAPVFLKHVSVQGNIFLCKGSHQVEPISKLTLKHEERHCNKLQVGFIFLFCPPAPISETERSLVTHLSSVLKNLGDFSGAKNKSFFFLSMEPLGADTLGS